MKLSKMLALAGLFCLAGGGVVYAQNIQYGQYGLFAALVGSLLILAAALISRKQLTEMLSRRSARLGLGAGLAVLAVAALVIFLGALAARHNLRWDLTEGGQHTLAPQTLKVLKALDKPVKAYAFFREAQAGRVEAQTELDQYAYASPRFTFEMVDPDQNPGLAKRFDVRAYGTVVLVREGKEERVQLPEEEALTNALIRLTREGEKSVYFLTGHGEASLDDVGAKGISTLKKAVEQQNYKVKSLMLATSEAVPPDASAVISVGPRKPFLPQEMERLDAYLGKGGGFLLMIDPDSQTDPTAWLKQKGIILGHDLVLDPASRLFGMSPAAPLAAQFGFHDITKPLEGMFCYFPLARSVSLDKDPGRKVEGVELLMTSPNAWAESDAKVMETGEAEFDEAKDVKGPVSLGVVVDIPAPAKSPDKTPAASKEGGDKPDPAPAAKGRLVVLGDSDFVGNEHLEQAANRDLALNSISFLAAEEDLVSIAPKARANQPLLLQPGQAWIIFLVPVVIWPALFLVIGVMVYLRRRRPA